ncbi:unnamed protein product [Brachionus calyciflorus]|uniref:F-box domain-containing protein n=1 Tax=Brachionus calyciflorus TaxID=104777 RepID=A0A814EE61_9BILA|nr:unnamed protein product [Brachionus calyciflorus]
MHSEHCSNCYNSLCTHELCPIVECTLKCGFKLHECKLAEHLSEMCYFREIQCINETNGCRIRVKKIDLIRHLEKCPANVVQCTSFRMRKISNKYEKYKNFKFPDPIRVEMSSNDKLKNLNDILLDQDYESLKKFCAENPLKFQRTYGYLIGLKLNPSSSEFRLSFLNLLLKTVKSRIFKDIEAENCIVFNDDIGCIACQTRIKYLEISRFEKLKKDRYHFDFILRDIITYEDFIEKKIYLNESFLKAYEDFYLKPNRDENILANKLEIKEESKEELEQKLKETNLKLLECTELSSIMKLNVAKELPCDAFQITYESYRLNDTHFSVDCNELLRRDEFSEHYDLYHNFIFNNSEDIDKECPFRQYGCGYFKRKYDFMFTKSFQYDQDLKYNFLNADLCHNKLTNQITFNLNNLNIESNKGDYSLLDLPFDILYEIFKNLDSLSIYTLSLTSKSMRNLCENFLSLKGIVYPKWIKMNEDINDRNNNNLRQGKKWKVEKYIYCFTKHIEPPKKIKFINHIESENNYNQHVQNCQFRFCKHLDKPFKLFPPYDKT